MIHLICSLRDIDDIAQIHHVGTILDALKASQLLFHSDSCLWRPLEIIELGLHMPLILERQQTASVIVALGWMQRRRLLIMIRVALPLIVRRLMLRRLDDRVELLTHRFARKLRIVRTAVKFLRYAGRHALFCAAKIVQRGVVDVELGVGLSDILLTFGGTFGSTTTNFKLTVTALVLTEAMTG